VSTWTKELGKSTLLSKKTMQLGDILASRISTEHTNRRGKLSVNHGSKTLVNIENLIVRRHKVKQSVEREIIYKDYIISMTPF
jgi:hypothetical protein